MCMPLRVVAGFVMQDLQPVPLITQTRNPDQMLTILRYTLA